MTWKVSINDIKITEELLFTIKTAVDIFSTDVLGLLLSNESVLCIAKMLTRKSVFLAFCESSLSCLVYYQLDISQRYLGRGTLS